MEAWWSGSWLLYLGAWVGGGGGHGGGSSCLGFRRCRRELCRRACISTRCCDCLPLWPKRCVRNLFPSIWCAVGLRSPCFSRWIHCRSGMLLCWGWGGLGSQGPRCLRPLLVHHGEILLGLAPALILGPLGGAGAGVGEGAGGAARAGVFGGVAVAPSCRQAWHMKIPCPVPSSHALQCHAGLGGPPHSPHLRGLGALWQVWWQSLHRCVGAGPGLLASPTLMPL